MGGGWALLGWLAVLLVAVAAVGIAPELRWRRWRWEVREQEIDIRHGTVAVTRTLVPMLRVQHVDTRRDLLQQLLGLATVVFHTAAGVERDPGADRVRRRARCATGSPSSRGRADEL